MIQQVDIFRLYIKVQIVTSIYTLATFIIEGYKYQMPLWCRLYQISDMLFFALLSGKLWTYTRDLSNMVIKGRIFALVSVQIYCRLISLIVSVLFISKSAISLLYVLTFVHSITLSFLSIIFIPQKTMVQFCLYVAAICVYLFINTFSDNVLHSLLITFTFYMLPIYGTSFDKQMQTFVNVQKTVQQVNKMGNVIINAFQNALPSKLIPKVMNSKQLPCEVVKNVNFCYLAVKNTCESVEYISKINQFYQMLDTLSDALGCRKSNAPLSATCAARVRKDTSKITKILNQNTITHTTARKQSSHTQPWPHKSQNYSNLNAVAESPEEIWLWAPFHSHHPLQTSISTETPQTQLPDQPPAQIKAFAQKLKTSSGFHLRNNQKLKLKIHSTNVSTTKLI
ncbi:Nucleotidyl_cyclase [Hexamita inflata]|uniref:Nucleotidyl cyclase n=1 Tax=Hexamita inflata TaxID=28002 RepID=A0AA86QS69_9EUKA|nr:Nucleotidyl cyclase [Hexamita inflata]CAI9958653.1 Nucleotidyl cyclase [Hexamita inflata]